MRREDEAPELDAEDRALLDELRTLRAEGEEPDWQKLEAAIRAEVGSATPRPWWRNWRWIVPIWALATTATVALLVTRDHPRAPAERAVSKQERHHEAAPPTPSHDEASAILLDGEPVDLDDVDDTSLDPIDEPARAALDPDDGDVSAGILPVTDLGWIDNLDEHSVDQVEHWLAKKRS